MSNVRKKTMNILIKIGVPDNLLGHRFIVKAVEVCAEDNTAIDNVTKVLYPRIAECFDTTPARVERGIRHAIETAWVYGDFEILNEYFGNTVRAHKGNPTNSLFLARIVNIVLEDEDDD